MTKKAKILLSIFATLFFLPLCIFAVDQARPEGLTVSPPLQEYEIKPGETTTRKIKVTNPVDRQIKVYPIALDFKAKGETGEPDFSMSDQDNKSYSLAKWISFSKSHLLLEPQEVEEFEFTISVPQNGEPGGHYGVVFFSSEAPRLEEDLNQVSISTMVGSLVLVKVPGFIVENAKLETFSIPKFSLKTPVAMVARISNLGNVHFKPTGNIVIKNIFGKEKDEISFNSQNGNVLPESIRKFENNWQPKVSWFYPIGRYTAELKIIYGDAKKEITATAVFWIIPIWVIILFIIMPIAIIFYFFKHRKKGNNQKKSHSDKVIDLRR